jgi:hypothetical protein
LLRKELTLILNCTCRKLFVTLLRFLIQSRRIEGRDVLPPPRQGLIFESVLKVTFSGSLASLTKMCPEGSFAPDLAQRITDSITPIDFRGSPLWSCGLVINRFVSQHRLFVYLLSFFEQSVQAGYCIVSRFLQVRLMRFLLQELRRNEGTGLRTCGLFRLRRAIQTKSDVYLDAGDEFKDCRYIHGLSLIAEAAVHLDYLFSRFPPYVVGAIVSSLFADTKVIVISSSFSELSLTTLGLAQLFDALGSGDFAVPVDICCATNTRPLETNGPCLIGLHSSMLDDLKKTSSYLLVDADVPYVTTVGVEPIPQRVKDATRDYHDRVVQLIVQKRPAFPAGMLQIEMARFWVVLIAGGPDAAGAGFSRAVAAGRLAAAVTRTIAAGNCRGIAALMFPRDPQPAVPLVPPSQPFRATVLRAQAAWPGYARSSTHALGIENK